MSKLSVNMLTIMVSKIVTIAVSMITGIFVARTLGVESFGAYSTATIFLFFIYMIFDCGFDLSFISLSSQNSSRTNDYFSNSLLLKSFVVLCAFIFVLFLTPLFNYSKEIHRLFLLFFIPIILPVINATHFTYLQIHEKFKTIAVLNLSRSVLLLVATASALLWKADITLLAIFQSIATIIITILLFVLTRSIKLRFSVETIRELLKEQSPFAVSSIISNIYTRAPLVYMTKILPQSSIGVFDAANKLTNSLQQGISSVDSSLIPKLFSSVKKGDLKATNHIISEVFGFICMIVLFASTTLWYFSDQIIMLLYGHEFIQSAIILKTLSLNLLIISFAPLFGTLISASGKIHQKTIMQSLVLILTISLSMLLIPKYGLNSVGVVITSTSLSLLVLYIVFARIYVKFDFTPLLKKMFIFLINMLFCTSILVLLRAFTSLHFILIAVMGLAVYSVGTLIIYKFEKRIKSDIKNEH